MPTRPTDRSEIRHDWSVSEILFLLNHPSLEELCKRARDVHLSYADSDIQKCHLINIKSGACPEDCSYCSQSAHHTTSVERTSLLTPESILEQAQAAKAEGATRICLGAAWRQVPQGKQFESLCDSIRDVASLGVEVCCTLGMANERDLQKMRDAGLTAYNHNLDTSRSHYPNIVSTRTYDDRINTLKAVRATGVQICCGGILGIGESIEDRASLLCELSSLDPHPESVPINLLVSVSGTPLEEASPVPFEELLRMVATARITMPQTRVRLSAGRNQLSDEEQLRCFWVGANSIFIGEKLLTAPNFAVEKDKELLLKWEASTSCASPA